MNRTWCLCVLAGVSVFGVEVSIDVVCDSVRSCFDAAIYGIFGVKVAAVYVP